MDIEEHGRFYIERQRIADADGRVSEYFDIGHIVIGQDGVKRYKPSDDVGAKDRDEALAWIKRQPK